MNLKEQIFYQIFKRLLRPNNKESNSFHSQQQMGNKPKMIRVIRHRVFGRNSYDFIRIFTDFHV